LGGFLQPKELSFFHPITQEGELFLGEDNPDELYFPALARGKFDKPLLFHYHIYLQERDNVTR
jgi:hypothetical protein